ncbi:MAG TPA: M28 family peptidase [Gemmatimonadaceae bacterium]|jgi:membrane-associated protease RseP (regulator of RpoE activity)
MSLNRFFCFCAAATMLAACRPGVVRTTASWPRADSAAIRRDIEYLASPALAGRLTGTAGNDSAASYIAQRYKSLKLEGTLQRFIARPPAHAGTIPPSWPTQNVFAILPGRDPALRGQYVVVGAHFDHLGTASDNALDPTVKGAVRLGADDNASGTAAVLELARLFTANPPRRSIVFANFTGEEEGLLGSSYFVDNSPVPLDSVGAMVNFDMVGRLRNDRLIVFGVATATELPRILDSANAIEPLKVAAQGDGFGPSDHSSFYAKNIPVLHFFTDSHEQYHRATDVPATINAAGEARVVAFAERVIRDLADRPARLTFVRAPATASSSSSSRQGSGVYLGSIPDMAGSETPGLRLTGVSPGSPADSAGLKAGDVIVEFHGMPVKDLYQYSDALYAHKPGDEVSIVVIRDGKRLTLKAKLGKRD